MSETHPHSVAPGSTRVSGASPAKEYLAFVLNAEHYAIDILRVREIRGYSRVTRIANAPDHIKGVLNLRGVIVPILDMRVRFGNSNPTYNEQTIVIVLNIAGRMIGVAVDAVSDVVQISDEEIMPAPRLRSAALTEHIVGVASRDERMLIVLDIEQVLSDERAVQLTLVNMEH